MKHNKKKIIPVVILIIIAAAFGFNWYNSPARSGELSFKGEVETTMVSHFSEVSGRLASLSAALGQEVKEGDILAVIDSSSLDYTIEQTTMALEKKKLALDELGKGADAEQIKQAQNAVSIASSGYASAKEAADKAALDYQNMRDLYNSGAAPKSNLDSAKLLMESTANTASAARKQIDNASQQLSLIAAGAKNTSLQSLALDVSITESQLAQLHDTKEKYTIKALCDGVVMSQNYTEGAMISPGADIIVLGSSSEKYLVMYVAKEDLHLVQYNMAVLYPNGEAIVKYIDVKSRYTPKDLQTAANKNKESMKVKALLPEDSTLIPGEQVHVIINVQKE